MSGAGQHDPRVGGAFGPPPPWKAERPIWRRPWFLAIFGTLLVAGAVLALLRLGDAPSDDLADIRSEQPTPVAPNPAEETDDPQPAVACLPTDAEIRNAIVETLRGGVTPVVDATLGSGLGAGAGAPVSIVAMSVVLPNGRVAIGTWLAPPAGPIRSYDRVAMRASTAPPARQRPRLDRVIADARGCIE